MTDPVVELPTAALAPLQSARFPDGYGDFALQSSDGVVFHIAKFLLGYTSPVFRDMFEISAFSASDKEGTEVAPQGQQAPPVRVTEEADTLDQMLRHIDPKQPTPILNESSIGTLLEAARKYQIGTIMAWFEGECMKHVEYPNNPTPGKSLMTRNPLLVLALATEYDMPTLGQLAACAIVGGKVELLQKDVNMPLKLYRHVYGLREERIQWYLQRIGNIANKRHRGKPVQPAVCLCSGTRSGWIHDLMKVVLVAPTWSRFVAEVKSPLRSCRPGCSEWSIQVEEDMMVWSHEAVILESALPVLPS